jgi:molybdopterin-guanine dinucleotide biosynthesis protein A
MNDEISIIIPTFHSKDLILISIKSFEKFCPNWLKLNYIIVENSNDVSYKDQVIQLVSRKNNVHWINNNIVFTGSEANASAIVEGLKHVKTDKVLLVHCDVCVTSEFFFIDMINKYNQGYELVGTKFDDARINAIHVSGLMVKTDIVKELDIFPRYLNDQCFMDVGDNITQYFKEQKKPYYCFHNANNKRLIREKIDEKFKEVDAAICVNDKNDVIFLHLARGIAKTDGTYRFMKDPKKVLLEDWKQFASKILS